MLRRTLQFGFLRPGDPLSTALEAIRPHFVYSGVLSFCINILYLASPLYMLQVYDRALTSGDGTTLALLTVVLLFALAVLAALDTVRSRVAALASEEIDEALAGRLLSRLVQSGEGDARRRSGMLRELDSLRNFVSGPAAQVFLDVPWTPVFILVCAMLHPWIGALALAGSVLIVFLARANELRVREATSDCHESASQAFVNADCALEGADEIKALGMRDGVVGKWLGDRAHYVASMAEAGRRAAGYTGFAKFARLALASLALGLGALLAIKGEITPGAMIAGSILVGRALTPLDQVFAAWRAATTARGSFQRIHNVLAAPTPVRGGLHLQDPKGALRAENLVTAAPGTRTAILKGVSLDVAPGEMLGLVGPTGAGKSTLAKLLAGVRPPLGGVVRLDGVDISKLDDRELGRHVGYLPQEVDLLPGTVADNISRFERFAPGADEDDVELAALAAARTVGAHDMILALPKGYDTPIGVGGLELSGGLRQRIALARAFYRRPALLVLDEPNSHLDSEGETALHNAMAAAKASGQTIVVVTHRASVLANADTLVLLRDGAVADAGRRDDVIRRLQGPRPVGALSGTAA